MKSKTQRMVDLLVKRAERFKKNNPDIKIYPNTFGLDGKGQISEYGRAYGVCLLGVVCFNKEVFDYHVNAASELGISRNEAFQLEQGFTHSSIANYEIEYVNIGLKVYNRLKKKGLVK